MNKQERDIIDRAIHDLSEQIRAQEEVVANLKSAREILARYRGVPGAGETWNGNEVCEYLKVKRTSLARYQQGHLPPDKPPFPRPVESIGKVKYWAKDDIITWKSTFHGN